MRNHLHKYPLNNEEAESQIIKKYLFYAVSADGAKYEHLK